MRDADESGQIPALPQGEAGSGTLPARREPGPVRRWLAACLPDRCRSLKRPAPAEDFAELGALERVVESLRYNLLSLEYALSPRGGLRQWLKFNLALLLLVGLPVAILAPALVYALKRLAVAGGYVEELTQRLFSSLENVFYSLVTLLAVVALLGTAVFLLRLAWVRLRGVDLSAPEIIEVTALRPEERQSAPDAGQDPDSGRNARD